METRTENQPLQQQFKADTIVSNIHRSPICPQVIHVEPSQAAVSTTKLRDFNRNTMASAWISACLVDISSWMMAHQLKLNPSKTELLVIPEGRGLHPVLDLRALNSALRKFRFKRLTTKLIASQIRAEDWFVTIDLKDAYFHIGIQPEHRKFLRFAFGGKVYQFRVLPFGLALSPCTFTKCMDATLVPLRLQGIRVLNYVDDWLSLAHSKAMAASHRDVGLVHMRSLGLKINPEKCVLSLSQRNSFLEAIWDSTRMQSYLSPARVASILSAVNAFRLDQSVSVAKAQD
ncbi:hypothetical protein QTP70_012725 [Hemibagrus guttatus]|uniref:ribonuclease H n=1 Tax=Hemibagrus guttatus TaxID=175788 RepID=A0AAE0RI41_9TELE|nr:hypothetical protein QTP70_012725 [Hemibagrus guttatus]